MLAPGIEEALTNALREANADFMVGTPLCDSCLGRLFGKIGTGTSNEARGQVIRECLKKGKLAEVNECKCCRGLTARYDTLSEIAVDALEGWEHNTFLIGSKFDAELMAGEEAMWVDAGVTEAESLKAEVNREVGKRVIINHETVTGQWVFDRP